MCHVIQQKVCVVVRDSIYYQRNIVGPIFFKMAAKMADTENVYFKSAIKSLFAHQIWHMIHQKVCFCGQGFYLCQQKCSRSNIFQDGFQDGRHQWHVYFKCVIKSLFFNQMCHVIHQKVCFCCQGFHLCPRVCSRSNIFQDDVQNGRHQSHIFHMSSNHYLSTKIYHVIHQKVCICGQGFNF